MAAHMQLFIFILQKWFYKEDDESEATHFHQEAKHSMGWSKHTQAK